MLVIEDRVEYVQELKRQACSKCGGTQAPHDMHFVHKTSTRGRNVSDLVRNPSVSMAEVLEEIEKCELVCATCSAKLRSTRRKEQDNKYGPEMMKLMKAAQRAVTKRNKALVVRLKQPFVCNDCGERFDPAELRFVHVRGTKVCNVSALITTGTIEQIETEAAKCDVLCKPCSSARWRDANN